MASVRTLKKDLRILKEEMIVECMVYKDFHPEKKTAEISKVINQIEEKYSDLVKRIQNPEDSKDYKATREYYKNIIREVEEDFVSILDNLEAKK